MNFKDHSVFVICRHFAVVSLILLSIVSVSALDIVKNSKSKAIIVIPARAVSSVTRAADELQYHIKKSTGAILPIIHEDKLNEAALNSDQIYLGDCLATRGSGIKSQNFARNDFQLKTDQHALFIVGKDEAGGWQNTQLSAGTLLGVYDFLNNQLGVRWLWPGVSGEVIPQKKELVIANLNLKKTLPLKFALWRVPFAWSKGGWSNQKSMQNFLDAQNVWLRRQRFNQDASLQHYPHGFTTYWKRFGKSNPEFFNLLPDGTRASDPTYHNGPGRLISMCVSNPELHKKIVEEWLKNYNPNRPQINVNENDTQGKCTCDNCMAWDESPIPTVERRKKAKEAFLEGDRTWYIWLGSVANRYAHFAKAVLAEADRVAPGKKAVVTGLIYMNYTDAPTVALNPRIVERHCPPMMFPWTEKKVAAYKKDWKGWIDTRASMILRPNFTWDGHCFPIFYARQFADCFRYTVKDKRLLGMDLDSLKGDFATGALNYYMIARLQRDFALTENEVINDFCNSFGPASKEIREYFKYLEKVSDECVKPDGKNAVAGSRWEDFYIQAGALFTPKVMERCKKILAKAARVAQGDKAALEKVKFLQIGLQNAKLTLETQAEYVKFKASGDAVDFSVALKHLDKFRMQHEDTGFANLGTLLFMEGQNWPRAMVKLATKDMTQLPLKWKFKFDPQKHGVAQQWYMPDLSDSNWGSILVNDVWEKQPVGKEWKDTHIENYNGLGWYRLKFELASKHQGQRVFLLFNAVDEACSVWVNGKEVLIRPYPYKGNANSWMEAFEIDITDIVNFDSPNQVTVKVVDNSGAGGIWKPVYLKFLPKAVKTKDNLVKNYGFEQKSKFWSKSLMFGKIKFSIDNNQTYSEQASASLTVLALAKTKKYAGKYGTWGRWYQEVRGLKVKTPYRFQFMVRTSKDFEGVAAVWVRSDASKGLSKANINIEWPMTGGKWKMFSAEVIPEQTNATIYLNIAANKGSIWFDDIELYPISGKAVSSTETESATVTYP